MPKKKAVVKKRPVKPQPILVKKTGERIVAKTDHDDIATKIAEMVGESVAAIRNEIDSLDERRGQLTKQLAEIQASIGAKLREVFPGGTDAIMDSVNKGKAKYASTRKRSDAPCAVCGFKTDPSHDGRLHRSQEPKAPFSDAELTAKSLRRV